MPKVVLIDDKATVRAGFAAILRAHGYDVTTAANGGDGIMAIERERPDVVLLDVRMPEMDGLATLREIRARDPIRLTPVLMLSAEADRARVLEAGKLGIAGYVLKVPSTEGGLVARIERTLREAALHSGVHAGTSTFRDTPLETEGSARPEGPGTPVVAADPDVNPAPIRSITDVKSIRPIITKAELLSRFDAGRDLTGFAPVVIQVLQMTESAHVTMDQIAKAVSRDPALALRVLRFANSPVFARGERVTTVHEAVLRIGTSNIRQAVLNIGVVERFSGPPFEGYLSTPQFWEHSIACGLIASEIARATGAGDGDRAFTVGLLHDLGRIVIAQTLGDQYIQVLEAARALGVPLEAAETRTLGINHAEIMDRLCRNWGFPGELIDPIVFHHSSLEKVRSLMPSRAGEALRLSLADRLAHAMLLGSSGNDTLYSTGEHCKLLGVDAATIRRIRESTRQRTDDTKFALLAQSNGQAWPRRVEQYRAALQTEFRPIFVSHNAEIDAVGIFISELAGAREPEGRPNLAVVHISASTERPALFAKLQAAEDCAGVAKLPVVLLQPDGHPHLTTAGLPGRPCRVLPMPLPIVRFVASVNELLSQRSLARAA